MCSKRVLGRPLRRASLATVARCWACLKDVVPNRIFASAAEAEARCRAGRGLSGAASSSNPLQLAPPIGAPHISTLLQIPCPLGAGIGSDPPQRESETSEACVFV